MKMRPHFPCITLAVFLGVVSRTALAGFSGSDVFLPMVGRQVGVFPSNWYTTVWIYNPGAAAATARIYLLERGTANPEPPSVVVLVPPGDTAKLENAVESLFHVQVFGALRVTCATQKLVVTSRVYSKGTGAGERDSAGQDFAGVPASFAIGAGERTQVLGVYQTIPAALSDYRFNFGFVETTGHQVNVRVRAFDGLGADQGFKDFNVREFSQRQVAFKDHFPGVSTENVRLEVEVLSGTGKVIAYGSGIANGSQDPTTFEMQYADKLLGIQNVQHDATLVGDGTAGAPLGLADLGVTTAKLADGAVTPAKVDVSGATTGQVLKVGSPAHWADDSLTLPYKGVGTHTVAPFWVVNTDTTSNSVAIFGDGHFGVQGTGTFAGVVGGVDDPNSGLVSAGVAGTSGTGIGVSGNSSTGQGVYGHSASGYGVHGESYSGDGVFGASSGDNKSGVYAVNTNPNGWAGYFAGRVAVTSTLDCTGCVVENDIAGGAVTKNKLSTTGSGTSGQILGTDGTNLAWQSSPGLTLPYASTISVGGGAFEVANTSNFVGWAIHGTNRAGSQWYPNASGVWGESSDMYGVVGSSDTSFGVWGKSLSDAGVAGWSTSSSGVSGQSDTGDGVRGQTGGNGKSGVYGVTSSSGGFGVFGRNSTTFATGYLGGASGASGVIGGNTGWLGYPAAGVYGLSTDSNGNGVYGEANNGGNAWGVWGKSTSGFAGYFSGNVNVVGNLSATGTKPFRIDHPLDPANKVLYHFAVESPDVSNVYHGNVVLDEKGEAVVELPAYFEALNRDVRYQLTCIGAFAPVFIAEKVSGNRFKIAGGAAGLEVSWQVTAIRNDPSARLRAPAVEQDKAPEERGFYLDPEAWGQAEELGIEWAQHPEEMKRMSEAREKARAPRP